MFQVRFIVVETQKFDRDADLKDTLEKIRKIADYQFGKGVGEKLFPENVEIVYSKRTKRIRFIYLDGKRLATLRPTDGLFSLSIDGAKRIIASHAPARCIVTVKDDASKFIAEGNDVFATNILKADSEIRPKDEVIVVNDEGEVLAVGKAMLSGEEMMIFKCGVAVKVRRGILKELSMTS
ncbi:MAG: PUA domain-containing protein [Candidatus Bathyarchaeia archaeon]